jgi:PAS domain S-box-containing protein
VTGSPSQWSDEAAPSRARRLRPWLAALPYAAAAVALTIALGAAYSARTAADARHDLQLAQAASTIEDTLERRLAAYVAMLRAGSGLFAATGFVTRAQFAAFVERLDLAHQYPGIRGIGVSLRVMPGNARDALITRVRGEGIPEFRIWPDHPRDELHAIVYLEPLDQRNRAALGYDMFTEPSRRAAMERARDTGEPSASGRVTLVQEIDGPKQAGFLIYVPVYRGGRTPPTEAERRAALVGFVYGPFRADDLLQAVLGPMPQRLAAFSVFDGASAEPAQMLHRSGKPGPAAATPLVRRISVAGRPWTLVFEPRHPGFGSGSWIATGVLSVGLLVAGLMFAMTLFLLRDRAAASRLAEERLAAEEHFRLLADAAPVMVWVSGTDKLCTFFNKGWLEFTGRTPEQELGRGWIEGVHPDDSARRQKIYAASFDARRPFEREYRLRRADGEYRWVLDRGVPRHDANGVFTGFIGACIDVEDRKRGEVERESTLARERAARYQAEQLAALGRAVTETLDLDRLGRVIVQSVRGVLGVQTVILYRVDDPTGDLYTVVADGAGDAGIVPGAVLPAGTATIGRAIRERRPVTTPDFLQDPTITMRPAIRDQLRRAPYRSVLALPLIAHHRIIGGLAVADVEGRVFSAEEIGLAEAMASQTAVALENARLFQEAQAARIEAEAANRAKDEFLAVLSHELRTPLNAVYGYARMLRGGRLEPDQVDRALEVITRNANAQVQLIDDLLDVSRIVTGKLRLDVRPVELVTIVQAAIDAVRPAAESKEIRLDSGLPPHLPSVSGDPDRLQQVVWNLLMNAVKFTPKGGRVQVQLHCVNAYVEFVVSDSGMGIAADVLPHIFERFRQGDSSSTRAYTGLGIGLALVRHLVELHGGTVTASSPGPGQGATFLVKLPVAGTLPATTGVAPGAERAVTEAGTVPLRDVRVLVVDDDRDSVEMASTILMRAGAEVRSAASAAEALPLVRGWHPDALVCDIEMPGGDGYGFIRSVRALGPAEGGKVPAVAVTAYGRTEDRIKTLSAGFNMHLPKPVDPVELTTVVATLVGR